jgi:hypothetical protein
MSGFLDMIVSLCVYRPLAKLLKLGPLLNPPTPCHAGVLKLSLGEVLKRIAGGPALALEKLEPAFHRLLKGPLPESPKDNLDEGPRHGLCQASCRKLPRLSLVPMSRSESELSSNELVGGR